MREFDGSRKVWMLVLAVITAVCLLIAWYLDAKGQGEIGTLVVNEVAWAGTEASASDEWYELYNPGTVVVTTEGWYLQTVREDGSVVSATLPLMTIYPGSMALVERTDDSTVSITADGIHGSCTGCGESLVGILVNSEIASFGLYGPLGQQDVVSMTAEYTWPAGNAPLHATMSRDENGGWFTANNSGPAVDAAGNVIVGTPKEHNYQVGDPVYCGVLPPRSWERHFEFVVFEDYSVVPQIEVTTEVFRTDENGEPALVPATVIVEYHHTPMSDGEVGWVAGSIVYNVETPPTGECIDSLEMLRDLTENFMNQDEFAADAETILAGQDEVYTTWLHGILDFAASNVNHTYLPIVER